MAGQSGVTNEVIDYRRALAVPGVEVIDARDSPREWRVITEDYSLVVFRTWRGRVRNLGRMHTADPSVAFCMTPAEAMAAKPVNGSGSFNVLQVQPQVLEEWLSEFLPSGRPSFSTVMKPISLEVHAQFLDFFDSFVPSASAMELQSQAVELSELMARELIVGTSERQPVRSPPLRGTARMRECLNEEGLNIDLDTLASRAGLSRFQALRSFKARYGLPPHAYQLCLRISEARRRLLGGAQAAEVAAYCGFADQSHFTRHFKRLSGVTPTQYARAHQALFTSSPIETRSDY